MVCTYVSACRGTSLIRNRPALKDCHTSIGTVLLLCPGGFIHAKNSRRNERGTRDTPEHDRVSGLRGKVRNLLGDKSIAGATVRARSLPKGASGTGSKMRESPLCPRKAHRLPWTHRFITLRESELCFEPREGSGTF